jgi:hypothetical protein
MNVVKLRKTIDADHVIDIGFTEPLYKKVKSRFYATLRATNNEWLGYYETTTGEKLVRNSKIVTVKDSDPIKVMQELCEVSKIISLEISDAYVKNLNENDGN